MKLRRLASKSVPQVELCDGRPQLCSPRRDAEGDRERTRVDILLRAGRAF